MYLVFVEKDEAGNVVKQSALHFGKWALKGRSALEKTPILESYRYIRQNGFNKYVTKSFRKVFKTEENNYVRWFEQNQPTAEELDTQRKTRFALRPMISIAVPLYHTPIPFLDAMIQSVLGQAYGNWQLCLANGSPDDEKLKKALEDYQEKDPRIVAVELEENLGIAGNTNAAIALAIGDYIALLDHDDILAPNALFEYVKVLNEHPDYDMFYSDEDKVDEKGKKHFEPNFKPDYNVDLFMTNNYICHFFMAKKEIVDQIGGFRPGYDGAQDYDFILRCIENGKHIHHVPKILYYWRCHKNSTARDFSSKEYAYDAGRRALQDHFDRLGMNVTTQYGPQFGWYSNEYHLASHPLVTVMIPNKDHVPDLKRCIDSIYERTTYDNYEILVIENNSTEPETFAYYDEMIEKHDNFRVVHYEGGFNYAAINNFGFESALGDYVLLLNNDVEVISENIFEHMLGFCMREDVGVVGAKLYYDDETIQHAGVVVGVNGVAAHAFSGMSRAGLGYMARAVVCQNYSAVTAACMMVKSRLYRELGGLDGENFAVAFNDIDFCLRVGEAGYRVVFDAETELYHSESKSRGYEDTPEKMERFSKEIDRFLSRWNAFIEAGDPCYNPNFSRENAQYVLDTVPVKLKNFVKKS
ncbi:MAG: glycosyltransferase family 2 protein [Lachnospiraceae bacterium]|nr:glycosyltransferase family 2 protein [Lachnospiraceae bacterium]